ncbi:MAG: hypothetical protein QOF48_2466 [Verrucomicrobiota bacterium]
MNYIRWSVFALVLLLCGPGCKSAPPPPAAAYENNFEKADLDKVPEDMLVLDGAFAVKQEGGNKFLELPGAPLETFGVLFGPTEATDLGVSARVHGTGKGRRFPTFGVGLNGVGGYRLQVSPGKKLLELYKGDEVLTNAPFAWNSDSWTVLRLRSTKSKDGELKVEGRAWKQGDPEPKDFQIAWSDKTETPAGRPSLWGNPFAGTAIRYDDLQVTRETK